MLKSIDRLFVSFVFNEPLASAAAEVTTWADCCDGRRAAVAAAAAAVGEVLPFGGRGSGAAVASVGS